MGRQPFLAIQRPQRRVADNTALKIVHDVERGADDIAVFAQSPGVWHRDTGVLGQGTHDFVLSFYHVGGGQGFARRLFAQHVLAAVGVQQKRGVGLATLELPDIQPCAEARYGLLQPGQEAGFIEFVGREDVYQLWGDAHFCFAFSFGASAPSKSFRRRRLR